MKGPLTPPRRRSLFVRGYDRPPIEGKILPRVTSNGGLAAVMMFGILLCFMLLFSAGYKSAKVEVGQPGSDGWPSEGTPRVKLRETPETETIVSLQKRLKIAVAVTVTRDGPYLDGAAVLQHSVRMTKSRHEIEMVAIVHSEVQTTRPALKALGFKVIEFPPPILSKDIRGKHLRESIDKSGCCGALELLKLCSWKLEDYDWVVSMDMDAIWLQNLDHLFETDIPRGGFYFTYDFAMDNPGSKAPPVQGGFIVVRPSISTFDKLIDIVREGDFRPNSGWGGTHIGWCWGGQTVQGLLAYFATLIEPTLAFPIDPCEYNSMATTKTCRRVDYSLVKSIHYTVCQKPWECRQGDNQLCAKFLHAWWLVRNDLEISQGLPKTGRCCGARNKYCETRSYRSLDIEHMKSFPMSDNHISTSQKGQIVDVPDDLPSREASGGDE